MALYFSPRTKGHNSLIKEHSEIEAANGRQLINSHLYIQAIPKGDSSTLRLQVKYRGRRQGPTAPELAEELVALPSRPICLVPTTVVAACQSRLLCFAQLFVPGSRGMLD